VATSQLPDRVACYRHVDHLTGVHCTRCGRPICPDCMVVAPVGHLCPSCATEDLEAVGPSRLSRPSPLRRVRATPVVIGLIVVNAIAFALTDTHGAWEIDYAQVPAFVAQGQWYRLLTAAFVHVDLAHLLFNMAALLIMGPPVEEALGPPRFLALYLLAGLGGFVCSFLFGPVLGASVGASGAIFGIFGAWFSLARARRADTAAIVLLIAILLAYSFYDASIDWRAHVGGLATGVAVGAALAWAARRPTRRRFAYQAACAAGLLALFAVLVLIRSTQIQT
jgi:membrane associated rhomboid family serine protease